MPGHKYSQSFFEELVGRQENRIYRTALAILGNVQDAEDQTQETFLRYLEKHPAFESEAHESAWLITVTRNGCISRLRSKARQNLPLDTDAKMTHSRESTVRSRLSRARGKLKALMEVEA